MQSETKTAKVKKEGLIFDFVKGNVVSLILSLGLVILFAFCFKWFTLPESVITPVTFAIKGLSVAVGALIAVKGSRGLLKGISFGAIFCLLSFVVFSCLAGTFSFGVTNILDLVFAMVLGGIIGIIKVNRK